MALGLPSEKQFAAALSVALNLFLITLKLVVGTLTGSIAVVASAIDSIVDLVASLLAFFAIRIADEPADEGHPFGHGKFEDFAGLLEAVLIVVGAGFILNEAIQKLLHPSTTAVIPGPAILTMAVALILDFVVAQYLFKVAQKTGSTALEADAHHLSTDVWTSIAVIAGLLLVQLTKNSLFDPLCAILVAVLILGVGLKIIRTVFNHLMDSALPETEIHCIHDIINSHLPTDAAVGIDTFKTKRSGSNRFIIFNLLVDPQWTVQQAHDLCDALEEAILQEFPSASVSIHVEPFSYS
jgi:cation diffusion facilitator family transporter